MSIEKINLPTYIKALLVMIFILVLIFFLIVGKNILIPLAMGGFFAVLFTPFCNWLESKKTPRVLSTILALLVMIALVGGLLAFVIGTITSFTNDFENVSGRIQQVAQQIDNWTLETFGIDENFDEKATSGYLRNLLDQNSKNVSDFLLQTVGSLTGAVLIPLFMFFFLLYRDHLTQVLISIYRDKDSTLVQLRIKSLRKVIQNYLVGVGKVMLILAVLNISAYSALGIKHAIFFGLVGAILNIIPYVGPFFGVLLPAGYSFLTEESLFYPIAILVIYQIIQMFEGNYLTPKIVGGNVNLNAFVTLLGLLVGGTIWGVAGMILAIPVLAILREVFDLDDATKPYALLLGEEKKKEKIQTHENKE
jgi:predicted PurR-regulated permease PerM